MVFPMFLIILLGGSRSQKIKAGYYFLFFTIFGSLLLFISINYLIIQFNTVNLYKLYYYKNLLTDLEQRCLWLTFFLSFAIKIPMFPFHTWLPEAHVEAPTIGSMLLAGILLKLGCYGFIRIILFLFPLANVYFSSDLYILCLISIFYSCIIAIRQSDLKRIIAYASIAHMNLIVLGIFSFTTIGIYGSIFQSVSHGVVSSGLFFLVGVLYIRYKSRIIQYYSGLTQVMPLFSFIFLFFILANISFPLTSNFIGELLLFIGILKIGFNVLIISLLSIILNTIYSLWCCNRILYGNLKSQLIIKYKDLTFLEINILLILIFCILILGIFPNILNIGNLVYFIKILVYNNLKF
jgi:proton-translocating NADH-quinone oxidoreductase chain M